MAGVPRVSIPLRTKLEALRRLDEGLSLRKIAKEFGVGRTTVFEWRKNRAEIEHFCQKKTHFLDDTRMSRRLHEQHDELLYEWYATMRREGHHVTIGELQRKALEINRKLNGPADFMASEGWLEKWKWRHKVRLLDPQFVDVDSLPVQERLRDTTGPSSPTVAPPVQPPAPPTETPSPVNQQPTTENEKDPDEVCLRWNSHHTNMKCSFPSLLEREQYVDVTLCAEGQSIRCHRLILSSCSSYFEEILAGITPLQHPVIILRGIQYWILKSLIDFMYVGEVHIEQARLQEILEVAEILKIKGLTGKTPQKPESKEEPTPAPATEPPPLVSTNNAKPQKSAQPVRVAVTKEQAASMTIVDPLSLLKPTFYEETSPPATSKKSPPVPIRPRPQTANESSPPAAIVAKQKDWVGKRILNKKKLKRKSTEHEPSPPPVILRKGTKSRPIVKAPKYYHMEYEEKDEKQVKEEDGDGEQDAESANFDPLTVKSEPVDMDIEDNNIESHLELEDNDDEANAFIATECFDDTGTGSNKDAPLDPLKDKTNQEESNKADSNG